MLIDIYFMINPVNNIKLTKYLESINWRISHVTKRSVKKQLVLPDNKIHILTGNLRSTEFPLLLQYSDSLLIEFPCHLLSDSFQVSVKLSDHLQSTLSAWVSEDIWFPTFVEAPLWPEASKSLKNVNWPNFSVALDIDDIQCHVGGVPRRSMSNEAGFFSINDLAQSVDWSIPQVFSPPPPPPSYPPPPPFRPGRRHAGTSSGSNDHARGRGRARPLPGGRPHARGLGPRYRRDQLAAITRRLFDQSSNEYDSLTPGHHTPPRRSSPPHSSPPRHSTPPPSQPPPQRGSSPVAPGGQVQAEWQSALGAMQAIYGPTFGIADMIQGLQHLALRPRSPSAIHTVEPEPVEAAQHLDDEGLWNRDVSGRLQRVPRGQTGGSDEQHNL